MTVKRASWPVALSEVRFFGVVPEPSSLVLAVFGLIGSALRSRRRRDS